jgi:hypothetical protein
MAILNVTYQQGYGLIHEGVARNGRPTNGFGLASLANYINMISARRLHVLGQGGGTIAAGFAGGAGLTGRGTLRCHTSPNCAGVECLMVFAPSTSTTVFDSYIWTVGNVTAAETYGQSTRYLAGNGAGASGPNDIIVDRQRFKKTSGADIPGDVDLNLDLEASGFLIYYIVYEVQQTSLDTSSHTCVPLDVFHIGAPILDRDIADLQDTIWTLYKRQGVTEFSWQAPDAGSEPSQTGTTYKNILDASTAGYSSSAAGFWTVPYRKNRLAGTTVDVVLWATGAVNTGTGGRVRFSNSAGVIGTITGYTTSRTTRTTTATLDATLTSSDLVIVEHSDSAGNTMTTMAAGMIDYLA